MRFVSHDQRLSKGKSIGMYTVSIILTQKFFSDDLMRKNNGTDCDKAGKSISLNIQI